MYKYWRYNWHLFSIIKSLQYRLVCFGSSCRVRQFFGEGIVLIILFLIYQVWYLCNSLLQCIIFCKILETILKGFVNTISPLNFWLYKICHPGTPGALAVKNKLFPRSITWSFNSKRFLSFFQKLKLVIYAFRFMMSQLFHFQPPNFLLKFAYFKNQKCSLIETKNIFITF